MTRAAPERKSGRRPRSVLFWLGLFLLPCAALAAFGAKTAIDEVRREDADFLTRGRAAADAFGAAAAEAVRTFDDDAAGMRRFSIDAEGGIRIFGDAPTSAPAPIPPSAEDRAQIDFQRRRVDQLLITRTPAEVVAEIESVAKLTSSPSVLAWAVWTIGQIERRAGATDRARTAFRRVARERPGVADERGVPRRLAAEIELLELGDEDVVRAIDLERRTRIEYRDFRMTGIGYLVHRATVANDARVRALDGDARTRTEAAIEAMRAEDRRTSDLRRLRSLTPAATADVLALSPGAATGVVLAGDPLDAAAADERWIIAAEPRGADGPAFRAIPENVLLERIAARGDVKSLRGLGFTFTVVPRGAAAPALDPGTASIVVRTLERPLDALAVHVVGPDAATRSAAARERRTVLFAFLGAAVIFAATAAMLTVRALAREAALVRDREQFVAAVTHELKAPTASIRLLAEILEPGTADTARTREFAGKIVAEADRLGGLVESVLHWAKDEHAPGAAFVPVELGVVVRETVERMRPAARAGGFEIEATIVEARVLGDAGAIARAIVNLLDNAIKYADRPHTVEVVTATADDFVDISVRDRGRGIPAGELDRIFRPFTRVGDEMTRDRPGVGLGLALVRRTAATHGGDAWCEPREGGGSIFVLRLARRPPGVKP